VPTTLTYDDIRLTGRQEALRKPTRFNPAIIDTEGSDIDVVLSVGASMSDEVAGFAQQSFNEVHLSTAAKVGGEVLDRFVWDRYQLIRQEAQQSVATLSFSRPSAASPVTIPAATVVGTVDGQTFETVNELVMGTGVLGPVTVTAQAQIAGELSNVEIGAINQIISTLTDRTVVATNLEPAAGGIAVETDDALADRARNFFINARRGTRQAIENGCVTTPGVSQATVTEQLDEGGDPNFRVQAIISDENGQANAALASRVTDRLEDFRALGVPVRVTAGVPQFVNIVVEGITFASGANTTRLIDQIRAQIVNALDQQRPGKPLERATIFAALRLARLVTIPETSLVEPAGDLLPATVSSVIRTTKSRVSINGQTGGS